MWQNNTIHIGGADIPAEGNRTMEVVSPANLKSVGSVGSGSSGDIDRAVAAARSAFGRGQWRAMSGAARGALLSRLADLIERDAAELGEMDARSIGRPTMETQILDLPNAVATFRYYAGWADKLEGRVVPTAGYFGRKTHSFVTREPIGVIGMIVPWNTPLMILSWKLAPALATGCTCVIKPAEQAPFSALRLGQLALEAGIPAGVINVVPGLGQEAGAALAQHPGIDKISFTGSPETGGVIMRAASQNFTRVALELGGKSPQIVFDDCDVEAAVGGCAMGLFFNQGQVCAAGTRIFVHRSLVGRFTEALAGAASSVVVGDPAGEGVQMGALATRGQFERVDRYVKAGLADGARMITGGALDGTDGYFYRPTLFDGVSGGMKIVDEEIFGPVGCIIPFDTVEEAIEGANATRYGLAATIWTRDISRALSTASAIRAGAVSVNGWATIDPALPWGGFKTSGIGRELGLSGIEACTEEKVTTLIL
jgi:betaine-aldehyde dehydrogenase